ncbi:helicase-related protein, partial [bacterium]|nr:helicase-related protein [bacterium]
LTIKQMEKARERMENKLKAQADTGVKDRAVAFDDLGVDALFVDESHEFKNLFINTQMTRVAGLGNLAGSDKAFDLFVKVRYIQQQQGGRGVFFATGTPISNTIAELYTVQRYMQYDEMKNRGIAHFDAWASVFGSTVTGWELDATGMNYKLIERFARFQNVPELTSMYRTFSDVITQTDLQEQAARQGESFPVPKIKGGKPRIVIAPRSLQQAHYMGLQNDVFDEHGQPVCLPDGGIKREWTPGSIIHRMENRPTDPREDNPLKITNDARLAGLDFRCIEADAPDFAESKINLAVRDTFDTWRKWNDRRGTQLIFCDLSTPKKGAASKVPVKPAEENEDGQEEVLLDMDDLLASNGRFSVYDDIKEKLMALGVPEAQIRFIHDAKTDLQKQKLFDQMNRGEVRILIGSTAKMGAGMNVQKRLVASRHLDAPWRPSDLEQRDGRILRQGNEFYLADPENFEVDIVRYATEKTYDARMWQTIEVKARSIEQFRKGDGSQRVIEDIAGEAANAAEIKAAATGNPLILVQVQLAAELKKLEALQTAHRRNKFALEQRLPWLEDTEERAARAKRRIQSEIKRRDANTPEKRCIHIGDKPVALQQDELKHHIASVMKQALELRSKYHGEPVSTVNIGRYRGFEIGVHMIDRHFHFTLAGETEHHPDNLIIDHQKQPGVNGLFQRIDNYLGGFESRIEHIESGCRRDLIELQNARDEVTKPFAQEEQLSRVRKDVSEVIAELQCAQANPDYISTWRPCSGDYSELLGQEQPSAPKLSPQWERAVIAQKEVLTAQGIPTEKAGQLLDAYRKKAAELDAQGVQPEPIKLKRPPATAPEGRPEVGPRR